MKRLKKFYGRLPVIRELRRIHQTLVEIEGSVVRHSSQEADQYVSALLSQEKYQHPLKLNRYEFKVYSQNGEDGILAEIFRRIGVATKSFVEVGVGNGLENNTTFLLLQGWAGSWIDADAEGVRVIRDRFSGPISEGRLRVQQCFVTAENINALVEETGAGRETDLLSLDIDRNTYFVWEAMAACKPRVVVVEYNASLPPDVDWKVEYKPDLTWNHTMYFGASLKALELLGARLGYVLVGCDLNGVNAFFVRSDLVSDKFAEPFTAENHFEPPRYWLRKDAGHPRCFSDFG